MEMAMRGKLTVAAGLVAALAIQPAITTAFGAQGGIPGASSCTASANLPDEEFTPLCLQVTQQGATVTVLLQTAVSQSCMAKAMYWPPLQRVVLTPDSSQLNRVNVRGQLVYSLDTRLYAGHGSALLVTASCGDGTHANVRSVSYHSGDLLTHPIAAAAIAPLPDATATPYVPGPRATPGIEDYHFGVAGGVPGSAPKLSVEVKVAPDPVPFGAYPTLTVLTSPTATCDIKVLYDTGRQPTSYPEHSADADIHGKIVEQGVWHMESIGAAGTAFATCSVGAVSGQGSYTFAIA